MREIFNRIDALIPYVAVIVGVVHYFRFEDQAFGLIWILFGMQMLLRRDVEALHRRLDKGLTITKRTEIR